MKTLDRNSVVNQKIKGDFVGREVFANVNTMVEYILQKGFEDNDAPFSYDDLENFYQYSYNGKHCSFYNITEDQKEKEVEDLKDLLSDLYDEAEENPERAEEIEEKRDEIGEEIEEIENLDTEQAEVFEWWAVSSWLFDKLKEKGEVVLDAGSCYVWGRCTTGQAILLDGVISDICEDLEILEGQESDMSKS